MNYYNHACSLVKDFGADEATVSYWKNSPFEEIRTLAPATKGKFGEQIIKDILIDNGYQILPRSNSKSDFKITDGITTASVEAKMSLLWIGPKPFHKFQQIRFPEGDENPTEFYDLLLCLGICKDYIKLYAFTKKDCKVGDKQYSIDFMIRNADQARILTIQHARSNCWLAIEENCNRSKFHSNGSVKEALQFIDNYFEQTRNDK